MMNMAQDNRLRRNPMKHWWLIVDTYRQILIVEKNVSKYGAESLIKKIEFYAQDVIVNLNANRESNLWFFNYFNRELFNTAPTVFFLEESGANLERSW